MSYPEESLAGRLLENDPKALGEVIRWIAAVLTSPRFWPLRPDWSDLHQEILTRVVESLRRERFDPSRDFQHYVQGVARYTALQMLSRKFQSSCAVLDPGLREDAPNPDARIVDQQLVRRILDLASEECRELIRNYFFEQRSYTEIAGSLSLPVGTVKSRLFRCLESAHEAIWGKVSRRPRKDPG